MTVTRQHFLEGLQAVRTLWSGQHVDRAEEMFADAVRLSASHRGETAGRARVIDALRTDFAGLELDYLGFNNRVARAEDRAGLVSAYFHGRTRNPAAPDQQVMFGGLVIVSFDIEGVRSHISGIKTQLTWTEGASALLGGWCLPPAKRHWQPGDLPAVIVSELDSAWNRFSRSDLVLTDEEAIAEAWYRYAWALDQADFALFEGAFSEDIEAELTPMGHMRGRCLLMGTLKAFRMPWPFMANRSASRSRRIADRPSSSSGASYPARPRHPTASRSTAPITGSMP